MEWAVYLNGNRCSKFYHTRTEAINRMREFLEGDKNREQNKKYIKGYSFEIKEGYNGYVRVESGHDPETDEVITSIDIIEIDCR